MGQGGFGITYLATQDMLERKVAVKEFFIRNFSAHESEWGSADRFLNKFINEARTISSLRHPAIIPIHDVFCENGTAYYVMEYIEGESLDSMLKWRGPFPQAEALSYIRSVGDALSYIHQRGINHLDVKPGNIMLRRTDNQIILIDFGVAKQYDLQTNKGTSTTPVGISSGYSPPEQYCRNGVQMFSPEADVYALAATLFTLLTGQIPPEATVLPDVGLPVDELRQRGVSERVINAIVKAMKLRSSRTATVAEFLANIGGDKKHHSVSGATKPIPNLNLSQTHEPKPLRKSFWSYLAVIMGFFFSVLVWAVWEKPWHKEEPKETVVTQVRDVPFYIESLGGECTYSGGVDSKGKPHGHGEARFKDGNIYDGSFNHGVAEGEGRYIYTDGNYWKGTFREDNPDKGDMYNKDGKITR